MSSHGRPLSPHLSIYRWPITMATSILHRVSGVYLSLGLVVFACWLLALAAGDAEYARFLEAAGSALGRFALFGWLAAFFYHLANGIRHIVWDLGYGFELGTANASGWFVVILTLLLTGGYGAWVLT